MACHRLMASIIISLFVNACEIPVFCGMLKWMIILIVLTTTLNIPPWTIDTNFSIRFADKYADGYFSDLSGTIIFDTSNLRTASFNVVVKTASINTGNKLKNKHAKGEHWLNEKKFPLISFASDSVCRNDQYLVHGKLTIKDIVQSVIIPFQLINHGDSAVFEGTFRVDRAAFALGKKSNNESDSATIWLRVPVSQP